MDSGIAGLTEYKMFIGGEWVESASGNSFESFNPYTAQPWALMPKGNADDATAQPLQHNDATVNPTRVLQTSLSG